MTELPKGWAKCVIGDVLDPVEMISNQEADREIWYADISSIDSESNTIVSPKRLMLSGAPSRARQKVLSGDVLFSTVRPYLRKIAAVSERYNGEVASTGFAVLRGTKGIEPGYLFYKCISHEFVSALTGEQYGVSYPAVKDEQVKSQPLELPPTNEQRRIVEKIEAMFERIDKGVENLRGAKATLALYRQSLLKSAFEGKLTADWRAQNADQRSRWNESLLGNHIDFLTSGSRGWADYYAASGDLFIRAQNLKHDLLSLDDVAYVKLPEGSTEGTRTKVKLGDLLITITGANVTKTGLVETDLGTAYVSQHVALCRLAKGLAPRYAWYFLLSNAAGRKQLEDAAYGAGKPGLNLANIREVKIPICSPAEQAEITRILDTRLTAADMMEAEIDAALSRAEALRQSILKRAFAGNLVPQDPTDEPAPTLLARIKAERAKAGRAKPARKVSV